MLASHQAGKAAKQILPLAACTPIAVTRATRAHSQRTCTHTSTPSGAPRAADSAASLGGVTSDSSTVTQLRPRSASSAWSWRSMRGLPCGRGGGGSGDGWGGGGVRVGVEAAEAGVDRGGLAGGKEKLPDCVLR